MELFACQPTRNTGLPLPWGERAGVVITAANHGDQLTVLPLSFFANRLNADHWIWVRRGPAASRTVDRVGGGAADRHW